MTKSGTHPRGSLQSISSKKRLRPARDTAQPTDKTSFNGDHTLVLTVPRRTSTGTESTELREAIKTGLSTLASLDRDVSSASPASCRMKLKDIGERLIGAACEAPIDDDLPGIGSRGTTHGYYRELAEVSNYYSVLIEQCYAKYTRVKQMLDEARVGSDDDGIAAMTKVLTSLRMEHQGLHVACTQELDEVDREYGLKFE
jgi:hypothetical protein